jgi:hypothetical protein
MKTSDDALALIALTISQVRRGQIDPKIANSVGYLTTIALRAIESSDFERRITELESVMTRSD